MLYSFSRQLTKGKTQEQRLDAFFTRYFTVIPATRAMQKQGIDRIFRGRVYHQRITVEYKADWTAASTGNVWLELRTADQTGWALKTQAHYLAYLLPNTGQVYMVKTEEVQKRLTSWLDTCEVRNVQDDGWSASGLLVPVPTFENICEHTFTIPTEKSTCNRN